MSEDKKKKIVKPVKAKEEAQVEVKEAPKPKAQKEMVKAFRGTGRRKEAVAKVMLFPGTGKIKINGKDYTVYFCNRKLSEYKVNRPFAVTSTAGKYDAIVKAFGGGISSQAGAVSLGIARALVEMNPELKTLLKREKLMTRDSRMKERKKYGLKRARKAFQYTKR